MKISLPKNLYAHIFLLSANIIFGINYPIAKGLMPTYFSPIHIILLRSGSAALFFGLVSRFIIKEKIDKKDFKTLILCGLFGVSLNQFMFFAGLNYSSPIDASIIMVVNPVFVLLLSAIILKEQLKLTKIIGIAAGLVGSLLIILYGKQLADASNRWLGNCFLVINAFSYALYLIMVKPMAAKYHPITIMFWTFLFGFIFVSPGMIYVILHYQYQSIPFNIWASLLYVIVASTIISYLFIALSMKKLSPTVVSFYIYLQPLISSGLSIMFFNEKWSIIQLISAALIFSGAYWVNKKPNSKVIVTTKEQEN